MRAIARALDENQPLQVVASCMLLGTVLVYLFAAGIAEDAAFSVGPQGHASQEAADHLAGFLLAGQDGAGGSVASGSSSASGRSSGGSSASAMSSNADTEATRMPWEGRGQGGVCVGGGGSSPQQGTRTSAAAAPAAWSGCR